MKMEKMFSVRGLTAIVTGGASGLGLAMTEVLAEHGARVTMFDMDPVRIAEQSARLTALGQDVQGVVVDVTDRQAVDAAVDAVVARCGHLDVMFANAGIDPGSAVMGPDGQRIPEGALENYDDAKWDRVVDISLNGVFATTRAAVRHMKPRGQGRIIVTTSVSSVRAMPIGVAYSAAKAAAAAFMRNTAMELARYNVLVNAIAPGPFVTNIGGGLPKIPAFRAQMERMIPLHRLGEPDDIKGLVLFLASPASGFMTGAEIFIDGGLALGAPFD